MVDYQIAMTSRCSLFYDVELMLSTCNRLTEVHTEDLTSVPNLESVDLRGNPLRPEVKGQWSG